MTIEVPTPSADLISQIETQTIETNETETAAIAAIRERFAPYAKHNGFIKVGEESQSTSNSSWSREAYYRKPDGVRMRGLLCDNSFDSDSNRGDQNRGTYGGSRLYLTEPGEWLEISRSGSWSRWQGEGEGWACGDVEWDGASDREDPYGDDERGGYSGGVEILTDVEVAARYEVEDILAGLSSSMASMCEKLPARYGKLKARAELAQRVIAEVK